MNIDCKSWIWQGRATVMAAALAMLALAGCRGKSGQETVYPVKGELFIKGQPAAGAVIWLHREVPTEAEKENPIAIPSARVQQDGSFEVSTYGANDGAPAGRYRVTVVWTKNNGGGDGGEQHLLPAHYMDPMKSGLPVVEIKTEKNELPRIQLP